MGVKRILVTGSSGTIGTRLCELLLKQNFEVIGVDTKPNKWNSSVDKLTIIVDLRDVNAVEKLPTDIDLVIHLAANARVYNLVINPKLARDNLETLFNMLEFCRKNNLKNFIFASSREVYGDSKAGIIHSEDEAYVKNCESPYTASKVGGEALVHAYSKCYSINFLILRFSNVYGMYDDSDRVIPLFIKLTEDNKGLTVYGKNKLFDFTYIDDAVLGIIGCIRRFEQIKNDIFNITNGKAVSIMKVAKMIQREMNGKNKIIIKENRTGEVVNFIGNIFKAEQKVGYRPQTDILEGIKKSVNWYRNHVNK